MSPLKPPPGSLEGFPAFRPSLTTPLFRIHRADRSPWWFSYSSPCTAREARAFGITAAIHSQPDYELPQIWAGAFHRAGFGGVRYLASHDPAQTHAAIAFFGKARESSFPIERTEPIPPALTDDAATVFGLRVLPS